MSVMESTYGRRLLVSVDAAGYGRADDHRQHAIQAGLLGVLEQAAGRAGLDRVSWDRQAAGDGELAVLPADAHAAEPALIDDFGRELGNALNDHNRYVRDEVRLRLRIAVHFGVVAKDRNGFSGQGPVAVSRLVDSASAKHALAAIPNANLVVVLSHRVFTDAVVQGHTALTSKQFRPVRVRNKEFDDDAYLYVPGHDVTAVVLPEDLSEGDLREAPNVPRKPSDLSDRSATGPILSSEGTFHGNVSVTNGNIGSTWSRS
ncbi:hypothetical protein ABZ413_25300 [Nocardia rhamnosiphila]|uniref:hypothetical protein n=1 Tax=Nocardia rhamnosiphila TaxID=426716 RepID=UPI0034091AED